MRKLIVPAAATATGLVAAHPAQAQSVDDVSWWNGGWGHMASGGIMMLVVWGGLIILGVILVRSLATGVRRDSDTVSALEILQQRYARGEIDHQEYEDRRRVLTESKR